MLLAWRLRVQRLDHAGCDAIYGGGWDGSTNTAISVDIYDGSVPLATVVAGTFRPDLLNAGIGNGYHSFFLQAPASINDGNPHTINVYYAGTTVLLNGGSWGVNCSNPGATGYHPYYSDTLNPFNTTWWHPNGAVTAQSNGITSSTNGSLISNYGVPDGTSDYEVRTTLNLTASGGNY